MKSTRIMRLECAGKMRALAKRLEREASEVEDDDGPEPVLVEAWLEDQARKLRTHADLLTVGTS